MLLTTLLLREKALISACRFRDNSATYFEDFVVKPKLRIYIYIFYTGHPLFQGVSHDLSCISYNPPSCSSLVSHPLFLDLFPINVSAVRRRLTIRDWLL
jgi:hypothetical protein